MKAARIFHIIYLFTFCISAIAWVKLLFGNKCSVPFEIIRKVPAFDIQ